MGSSNWPPAAGGATSDLSAILSSAALISPLLTHMAFDNDFGQDVLHDTTGTTAGTVTFDLVKNGGTVNLQTTATGSRSAFVRNHGGDTLVSVINTQPWYAEAAGQILTAVDAAGRISCIALSGPTEDVLFGAIGAVSTTNLVLQIRGAGTTNVTTTSVIDLATYHRYGLGFDATTVYALVDGVVVGSTAVLTNLSAQAGFCYSAVANGATAANRQLGLDRQTIITKAAA